MFENEHVFNFLINKLIDYEELYKELVISKEEFLKLLEKSKNFNHILTFLTYLGKDVVQFLNVVYEKREFILKKIELIIELEKLLNQKKKIILMK